MSYSRRRFLTDLLFAGGAIAAAAGLAATAEPVKSCPGPSVTPSGSPGDLPMPGQTVVRPSPGDSPKPRPTQPLELPLPGGMPPPPRPHRNPSLSASPD